MHWQLAAQSYLAAYPLPLPHAAMQQMSGEEYLSAARDPIAQFSAPVCGHMNDDHGEDMKAMIK